LTGSNPSAKNHPPAAGRHPIAAGATWERAKPGRSLVCGARGSARPTSGGTVSGRWSGSWGCSAATVASGPQGATYASNCRGGNYPRTAAEAPTGSARATSGGAHHAHRRLTDGSSSLPAGGVERSRPKTSHGPSYESGGAFRPPWGLQRPNRSAARWSAMPPFRVLPPINQRRGHCLLSL
jgi:hypothetical protein